MSTSHRSGLDRHVGHQQQEHPAHHEPAVHESALGCFAASEQGRGRALRRRHLNHRSMSFVGPLAVVLVGTLGACSATPATPEDELTSTIEAAISGVPSSEIAAKYEIKSPEERWQIEEMARRFQQTIRREFEGEARRTALPKAQRPVHAKHHGCVRAQFTVLEGLPTGVKPVGVLQPGTSYGAWIRFSNGSTTRNPDYIPDARGMAIKLVGVPGNKLLPGDERSAVTQDFVMINYPRAFTRDLSGFLDLLRENGTPDPLKFLLPTPNPSTWRFYELDILRKTAFQALRSPLSADYYSQTPSLLGENVIKFSAKPCEPERHSWTLPSLARNGLRERMVQELKERSACFDFYVQIRTDSPTMPVEDSTVEWDESVSPFLKVARIVIPAQTFDTPEQQTACENFSFSPWHSLPEHRPIGNLNRARLAVYAASSETRHDLNQLKAPEPTDLRLP